MNDIRRTILWVIFGFSMVLLWDKWQVHNGKQASFFPSSTTASAPAAPASAANGAASTSSVPTATTGGATAAQVPGEAARVSPAAHERVTFNTDVLEVTFDTLGGSMVKTSLPRFKALDKSGKTFVLLDESADRVYLAQTGLVGGDFPNHKTPLALVPGDRTLKDGQNELVVRFESPDVGGVKLVKTYTFERGSYAVRVQHDVQNTGTAAVAPQLYMQLVRDGNPPPGESSF